jgi:hypothetical protein
VNDATAVGRHPLRGGGPAGRWRGPWR